MTLRKRPGPKPGTPGHHRGGPKHIISQEAATAIALKRNPRLLTRIQIAQRRQEAQERAEQESQVYRGQKT